WPHLLRTGQRDGLLQQRELRLVLQRRLGRLQWQSRRRLRNQPQHQLEQLRALRERLLCVHALFERDLRRRDLMKRSRSLSFRSVKEPCVSRYPSGSTWERGGEAERVRPRLPARRGDSEAPGGSGRSPAPPGGKEGRRKRTRSLSRRPARG